jgi:hypothetical protein
LPILVRNDEDMATAFYYTKKAEMELHSIDEVPTKPEQRLTTYQYLKSRARWGKTAGAWAPLFQIIATAIIAFSAWWMLSEKPLPKI